MRIKLNRIYIGANRGGRTRAADRSRAGTTTRIAFHFSLVRSGRCGGGAQGDFALLFRAVSDKNDEAGFAKNYLDECAQG